MMRSTEIETHDAHFTKGPLDGDIRQMFGFPVRWINVHVDGRKGTYELVSMARPHKPLYLWCKWDDE